MLEEIKEGLGVVLGNPLLRSIAGCTGTSNLFSNAMFALFVLYATRELRIGPALLGVIFAAAGPGGFSAPSSPNDSRGPSDWVAPSSPQAESVLSRACSCHSRRGHSRWLWQC